jgi:hypothetical protein
MDGQSFILVAVTALAIFVTVLAFVKHNKKGHGTF